MLYPTPIAKLIDSYSKLPGIGIKTATRLAFYTIGMSDDDVNEFAKNLLSAKRELTYCSICGRLTDDDPCSICTDPSRDQTTILVLEDVADGQQATNTNAVAYAPSDNPQIAVAVVFPHNTNLTNGVGPSIARDIINLYQKYHPMN